MNVLGDKAIYCLRYAALKIGSPERWAAIQLAADKWSWRALEKKVDELVDRGYLEPLRGGTACGDLTAKGRVALEQADTRPPTEPPQETQG